MRSGSVALRRPTDHRQQRGIVIIAGLGNGTRTDPDGALTVINDISIDRPASDQGGCPCVTRVSLRTI
jgi:hypothetical protein